MLLLLHSCCCPACAEPVAGDGWALLTLSRAGYCSPCQRLQMLPLREDGRLSHSHFCRSAELLHSCSQQHPHGQNGFPHAKSSQRRAKHCAPPNLHVLQMFYSFSRWKACNCGPDFCTAPMPQHWASTEDLPSCPVTVSAGLNPPAGVMCKQKPQAAHLPQQGSSNIPPLKTPSTHSMEKTGT